MKNGKCPLIYHPSYDIALPDTHRFPGTKYSLLIAELERTGLIKRYLKYIPKPATPENLSIAHAPSYIESVRTGNLTKQQQATLGLPWSEALKKRAFMAPSGTLLAAQLALQSRVACHAAGGTHHAHRHFGAGFCVFNDLAFAALAMVKLKLVKKVLILDCDVHQGDGTASILGNEKEIFTCSIHCAENYPAKKAKSDLDLPISKGAGDSEYLAIVNQGLLEIDRLHFYPDLVLYDAAVDVHRNDKLGLLDMSSDGIRERDELILSYFKKRCVPIVTTIGGGYGETREEVAQRHSIVFSAVQNVFGC